MKKLICLLLAAVLVLGMAACGTAPAQEPSESAQTTEAHVPVLDPVDDNYRTFYQIFVGSFSDSNNDGIGDLRGIINRFDY